ncbi:O-antigen ligase family protein [Paenibacillus athensensis]|nr:O-antigen ligase family protein [Paenibacillus athensensis]MCD1259537.1 O-antigen ligase family protein [Paenibacillus athensensis]
MYKQQKKAPLEQSSFLFWLLVCLTTILLVWSPFQKALFNGNSFSFERPIFITLLMSSLALLAVSIQFFLKWNTRTIRDALTLFGLLIPLTYLISIFPAASHYNAMTMLLAQIIFFTFFLLGSYFVATNKGLHFVAALLWMTAYAIVVFGMMNWLGGGKLAAKLVGWFSNSIESGVYRDAVMTDSNGLRLTSVFQYANSYAAFLIAFMLSALYMTLISRKWQWTFVHAFMLAPMIVSFFLTLSRGAIVLIPAIVLIILFFLHIYRQLLFLLYAAVAFAASLLVLGPITSRGTDLHTQFSSSAAWSGWMILLAASLIVGAIAVVSQRYLAPLLERKLQNLQQKRFMLFVVPAGAVIVAVLGAILFIGDTPAAKLLPENVRSRLQTINFTQNSVLERGTFYKDAIKVFKDYPVIGAGGGAWSALYEKYQNNPYISRQAHNFLLQYLTEVGLVGLLVLLIFLASIVYLYIRWHFQRSKEDRPHLHFIFFIILISLLGHSLIDFDLSYLYLEILVYICLGALLAIAGDVQLKHSSWNRAAVNKTFAAVLAVVSVVVLIVSARTLSAENAYNEFQQVRQSSNNYSDIIKPLDRALDLSASNPTYTLQKVAILFSVYNQSKDENFYTQATQLVDQRLRQEPHNRQLVDQKLSLYKMKQDYKGALDFISSEMVNFPWDISVYEESMSLKAQLGNAARIANNTQETDRYWNGALADYNQIQERIQSLESLPEGQQQGHPFAITNKIALSLAQIQYLKQDYSAASSTLQPYMDVQNFKDATNKSVIRWYVASMKKQGLDVAQLYNNLVASDPNEVVEVQKIIDSR